MDAGVALDVAGQETGLFSGTGFGSWLADGTAVPALGMPGLLTLAVAGAMLAGLIATSLRRAVLERRDRQLFERFEARLAAWQAGSHDPAAPEVIEEARRILDDDIARHVQQDPSLDGPARLRFAETLRNMMRQRLEDVLIRRTR